MLRCSGPLTARTSSRPTARSRWLPGPAWPGVRQPARRPSTSLPGLAEGVPKTAFVSGSQHEHACGPSKQMVSVSGDVRVVQVDDNPYVTC